ncbi:PREDICTED: olfactory receptor 12D2-like [Nanorana parkeri]|uniref:olfactory receptor 12D2-like n=1 Tax=Nanorana parkeri TaxID=125878 RepID=UPI0008543551|nr:PREDICTED: olfactory receptor 12D2-like [Nanorana parkeri]
MAKAVEELNQTFVTEFILLGITSLPQLKILFFITFLMFYLLCFLGNLSIVAVVLIDHGLHTPMYFLLGNLSFLDFFYSTTTVPKLLSGLIMEDKRISFHGCMAQLHVFHFLGSTEAMLLMSMSYDRYIAICNPLRYHVLMSKEACIQLSFTSWLIGFLYSLTQTILTFRLPFCSANKVTAFYCDIKPLLKLACTDTHINESLVSIVTGTVALGTFILIVISYIFIATHLQNIQSSQGRHKALSTCTSHLTVVLLYYGTAFCTYLRPATKDSLEQDRMSAILFTVITPALNPLVYALRNKEVKRAFRKLFYDGYTFKHIKIKK